MRGITECDAGKQRRDNVAERLSEGADGVNSFFSTGRKWVLRPETWYESHQTFFFFFCSYVLLSEMYPSQNARFKKQEESDKNRRVCCASIGVLSLRRAASNDRAACG